MATILCVDNDRNLSDLIRYALARDGLDTVLVDAAVEASRALRVERPDLVLLDDHLPDVPMHTLLARMRRATMAPIVVLTARSCTEDIVAAFEAGADDYVTKPFTMAVLVARLKALLRRPTGRGRPRQEQPRPPRYELPGATFDAERYAVDGHGRHIALTATEGRLLHQLVAHAGQTLSAGQLLTATASGTESSVGVVKTHMHHLRKKLAGLESGLDLIQTVPGHGYRVEAAAVIAPPCPAAASAVDMRIAV